MQKNLAYETADRGVFDYNLSGEEFGTFSNFRNFDGKQKDIRGARRASKDEAQKI